MDLWEIDHEVSTPEHAFLLLTKHTAQPVGILIYGAACGFMRQTLTIIYSRIYPVCDHPYDDISDDKLRYQLQFRQERTALELQPHQQSEAIARLRAAGAQSIISICIHPSPENLPPDSATLDQLQALKNNPPNPDEPDHIIVITEQV